MNKLEQFESFLTTNKHYLEYFALNWYKSNTSSIYFDHLINKIETNSSNPEINEIKSKLLFDRDRFISALNTIDSIIWVNRSAPNKSWDFKINVEDMKVQKRKNLAMQAVWKAYPEIKKEWLRKRNEELERLQMEQRKIELLEEENKNLYGRRNWGCGFFEMSINDEQESIYHNKLKSSFLIKYYDQRKIIPKHISVNLKLIDKTLLSTLQDFNLLINEIKSFESRNILNGNTNKTISSAKL